MLEIERKFLLKSFPAITPIKEVLIHSGYLSVTPEIRIRKAEKQKVVDGVTTTVSKYGLTIKGEGTLTRTEDPFRLKEAQFENYKSMIGKPLIQKIFKMYPLPGRLHFECNLVDEELPSSFMYAEVEFKSEELANSFIMPEYLTEYIIDEVTDDPYYKMKNYWKRTRYDRSYRVRGESVI